MRKSEKFLRSLCFIKFVTAFLIIFLICTGAGAADITARSAVIMDTDSDQVLYAKNPLLKQPPASTAKLVTAMVVLDNLDTMDVTTISANAAELSSGSVELREGDRYYIGDLLHIMLMKSVNGAAVALAEAVSGSEGAFVNLMNKKAKRVGANNTRYINSHGLPGGGQYITAYDLAIVMRESLQYPVIKNIIIKKTKTVSSIDGSTASLTNTNKLLWKDDDLLGGKTGYTKAARHCLAFAAEHGENTFVAAVLGDSQRSNLWRSAETVLNKGYNISESHTKPEIHFSDGKNEAKLKKLQGKHHRNYSKASKTKHYAAQKTSKKSKLANVAKNYSADKSNDTVSKSKHTLYASTHKSRIAHRRGKFTAKASLKHNKAKALRTENKKAAHKYASSKSKRYIAAKKANKTKVCKLIKGRGFEIASYDPKCKPVAY
ncbi:D-alanyl-D-alanine carboxypeptidase family protein [Candidatus Magnetomonas plexicatena]|uniref:D-alanyl-D-alanine carboxypeptidase family protein n=1 Tax=Candidatus Magnetomonas plexicatena TaxID=2552947 RepID=UPI001104C0D7|nr:D-alanyl-D-alanine carboxypeptidase [Nitrospirales bacterium LBB_01]